MSRSRRARRAGPEEDVVYGRNPVRELLAAGRRRVREAWCLPELAREPWLSPLDPRPRGRAELGRAAGTSDHQGVIVFCDPYPYASAADVLAAGGPVVVLDGAQDPRNLGAVARVADAAGAGGLVIASRGAAGVTPAVSKASAGAVEHLLVARVPSVASFVHDARRPDRLAFGANAGDGEDYRAVDWGADPVVVLGAEGAGLRPRVRAACDALVHIPMAGRVESLNLAVATALLLFEANRGGIA